MVELKYDRKRSRDVARGFLCALLGVLFLGAHMQVEASQPALDIFMRGVRGFNLDKSSERKPLTKDDINALAASGAGVVRIILAPKWCESCETFGLDLSDQDYVRQVVAETKERGIFVIIALAPQPAGPKSRYWHDKRQKAGIVQLWERLATAYKDEPNVIAFDLINEPLPATIRESSKNNVWSAFALQIIAGIRQADPGRTVIFEPAPWGLAKGFASLDPLPVQNAVYSFHFYEPQAITHQGIYENRRQIDYPTSDEDPIGKWDKTRLSRELEPVRAFQRRTGVPIYVGEFSISRWAPINARYRYTEDVLDLFSKEGWSWTYHAFRTYTGWDPEVASKDPGDRTRSSNSPVFQLLIKAIRATNGVNKYLGDHQQ